MNASPRLVYVPKKGAPLGPAHLAGEDLQPVCGADVSEGYALRAVGTVFGWLRHLCEECREELEGDINFEQLRLLDN